MSRKSLAHRFQRVREVIARVASPFGLAVVLLSFGSGFLMVSCDTPGGYGRVSRGGTTTYSGVTLATGIPPDVDATHLRPEAQREPDRLPAQPLVTLSIVCVTAAGIALFTARRHRHLLTSAFAAGAACTLAVGILHARTLLIDRVADQTEAPMPRGKTAVDYVQIGGGFWLALIVLGLVAVGHFVTIIKNSGARADDRGPA